MSLKYNFAFKNSDLQRWEPNKIKEKKSYPLKQRLSDIRKFIQNNPLLIYPHFTLVATVLIIQILNLYPSLVIKRLKPKHEEYVYVTDRIAKINRDIKKFKIELKNLKPNFTSITPTYLFTFYLQNSIPIDIQLSKYKLNNNSFFIEAKSYTLKAINEMISLIVESPIIDEKSVFIKKIKRDNEVNGIYSVEITGKILKTNTESKEYLYSESGAFGLLEKLLRYKKANLLLK